MGPLLTDASKVLNVKRPVGKTIEEQVNDLTQAFAGEDGVFTLQEFMDAMGSVMQDPMNAPRPSVQRPAGVSKADADKLEQMFEAYDIDGNGFLDNSEMGPLLTDASKVLNVKRAEGKTIEEQVNDLTEAFAGDDGVFTLQEFMDAMGSVMQGPMNAPRP